VTGKAVPETSGRRRTGHSTSPTTNFFGDDERLLVLSTSYASPLRCSKVA
jgi:hypothetical protein